jgi:hypothetical protein
MIDSATHPPATLDLKLPLWRELLNTTLGYLAWGYGAVALSLVGYCLYASFAWMAKYTGSVELALMSLVLALIVISRLQIAIRWGSREISIRWGEQREEMSPGKTN